MAKGWGIVQDSQGNAIEDCVVKVYLAGTSTLASIFSDSALSVAVDQVNAPVETDATGHYQFFVAVGSYKLEGTKGSFTFTEDNVDIGYSVPATRTIATTSPLTGGGDLSADRTLGFDFSTDESVTGAWTFDELRGKAPWANVKAFGATGDGVTNDATAIDAALASLTSGGILYFPVGTYVYSGAGISHNPANGTFQPVTLVGDGAQASTLKFTGVSNTNAIYLSSQSVIGSGATKGYGIRHLKIDNDVAVPSVVIENLEAFYLEDVWVDGGTIGLQVDECRNCYFSQARFTEWTTHGIDYISDVQGDNHFSDVALTGATGATGNGFRYIKALASGGGTVYLHRVKCFKAPSSDLFRFESTAGQQRMWIFLDGCVVDVAAANSGGAGFHFKDCEAIHAANCHVTNHGTNQASVKLDNVDEVSWIGGATNADTGSSAADFSFLNSCERVAVVGTILKGDKTHYRTDATTHTECNLDAIANPSVTSFSNDWSKFSLSGIADLASLHRRILIASDWRLVNAALGVLGERYVTVLFDEASADDRAYATVRLPSWWGERAGTAKFTATYTGTASSTSNIRLAVRASADALTDDITAAPAINGTEWLLAGPATANQLQSATFATSLAIAANDRVVGIRLQRDGTHANDTYTGDFHLVALTVEFFPG